MPLFVLDEFGRRKVVLFPDMDASAGLQFELDELGGHRFREEELDSSFLLDSAYFWRMAKKRVRSDSTPDRKASLLRVSGTTF